MNYYNVLGVSSDAPLKEINKNFKELSNRYHPDKNPGDKYSEEKMKLISEAYSTLSDYNKRVIYDSQLKNNEMIIPFKMNTIGLIEGFDLIFNETMKPLLLMDNSNNSYSKSVQTTSIIENGNEKTIKTVTENGNTYTKEYTTPVRIKHTFY